MKILRILVPATLAVFAQQTQAQVVDYLYAIMNDGGNYHFDEVAVSGAVGSQSISQSKMLDLNSYIDGFGAAGRYGENVNGLAIDTANQRVYFNYTYGDGTSNSTGNYHFQLYSAKYDGTAWAITTVGDPLSAPLGGTSVPVSGSVGDGAFPRAAFRDGNYYMGGQLRDNVVELGLNADGTAATDFVTQFLDADHGAFPNSSGGDFIFDHDGHLIISSVFSSTQYNAIYILNDAMETTGAEANGYYLETLIPRGVHGAVQLGGYGDSNLLYGAAVDGEVYQIELGTNLLEVDNIGKLSGGTVMDLSEGTKFSLVPEPTSALLFGFAGLLGLIRRKR